jgi:hypothetical protein
MKHEIKKTEQKALEINLNENIYGTFAEIGAGQEVARNFFQVGAAAGTIAKTMSAYDKTYSDAIYGPEISGRYVCEKRLYTMLDHEYKLMVERLGGDRKRSFFVFADTVAAINYKKTIRGNGWMGVRFQLRPGGPYNELVIHVKMLDFDNKLQQESIGVLGVNMIYACYYYQNDPEKFVKSLRDGLKGRIMVDLIRLTGPDFDKVDHRLLSLYLVKNDLTEVTMFDGTRSVHASEFLYRKSLMVVRGNFRPPTLVTLDVIKSSFKQFRNEADIKEKKAFIVSEITLEYLSKFGVISEQDYLDRADMLCALGQTVVLSNINNHQSLINYLAEYKIPHLGLVIGVRELLDIIVEKYYENLDGRLLVAFGELFTKSIKIYAYPAQVNGQMMNANNLPVPEGIKFLYKHLLDSEQIVEVSEYRQDLLHISPTEVLFQIQNGISGWEEKLPKNLVETIKEKGSFGYKVVKENEEVAHD